MKASAHPAVTSCDRWNEVVLTNGGHFLQAWEWGAFKSRHGWQAERVAVETGAGAIYAQILFRHRGPISVGYIGRGPVVVGDVMQAWPAFRREVDRQAARHRALFVIIEPNQSLGLEGQEAAANLRPGLGHIQPARTVMIPLADDETILKGMTSKTRYSLRLAGRRNVEVERVFAGDEAALTSFYDLMEETASRNEFHVHSKAYYRDYLDLLGDKSLFLFSRFEGKLAGTVMCIAAGNEAAYMYGASSTENRGNGSSFLLQFEAMKWARAMGCRTYDLWGIPTEDPQTVTSTDGKKLATTKGSDWTGIYRFKTGFGGNIVRYPDTVLFQYVPCSAPLVSRFGLIQV